MSMLETKGVGRRFFLVSTAAAGGLMLGFRLPGPARVLAASETRAVGEVNAWILLRPDDSVTIRVARSEMGQGSFTALPMLVAEELECDWSKVRAEYASASENLARNHVFGSMTTDGSRSIRDCEEYLRKAGAAAREMLLEAAAEKWGVPRAELVVEKGVILHGVSGRRMRYGEIAEAAAKMAPPREARLKEPGEWTLIGKPQRGLDVADKVLGKLVFGMDVRLSGMLYATIAQCPVFGGKLKSFEESKIKSMSGVRQVVALYDAVAVVADSYWQAKRALDSLPLAWDEGANAKASDTGIRAYLEDGLRAGYAVAARREGDVEAALAGAAKVLEAEYFAPFLGHATMEPMNATARVSADKVEVWAPSQDAEASLAAAAEAAGVDPRKVEVHLTMLGGGFGRRVAAQDYVKQAVVISKAAGRPVKLIWSREEDTRHDFYRPVSMAKFTAALDKDGMPIAWRNRVTGQSILAFMRPSRVRHAYDEESLEGLVDLPYGIPNILVDYAMRNTHVPVGYWRSVNHSQNAFYKESFLDEVAHAGGKDPYELRRILLKDKPKQRAVLDAAARTAEWEKPPPSGVYRGIAYHDARGSFTCQIAEVSVGVKGEITMHRIVCAIDPGHVVNPDTVEAQIEGGIVYGLSAALYGEITIKDGRVEQSNFDNYRVLRMKEMPRIEVVQVPSGGFWGGIGEVGVPGAAPALCNAIFAATGKRVRSLPLKNHDLRST
ncbi:MAG TPA: xanthine dehydrogenase family protein molybdopterin-binding subunit [Alphaproteobacteria bacterium]|nr:xanthine dehydrogenase family protein molybdopterin-binding subunit [Alphaproteobacteria bacterium]